MNNFNSTYLNMSSKKQAVKELVMIDSPIISDDGKQQRKIRKRPQEEELPITSSNNNKEERLSDSEQKRRLKHKLARKAKLQFGNFEKGDRVTRIQPYLISEDESEKVFKIFWKERPDGIQPRPSFADYDELKYKTPFKIIQWWEGMWQEANKLIKKQDQLQKSEIEDNPNLNRKKIKGISDIRDPSDIAFQVASNYEKSLDKKHKQESKQVHRCSQFIEELPQKVSVIEELLQAIQTSDQIIIPNDQAGSSDDLYISLNEKFINPNRPKNQPSEVLIQDNKISRKTDAEILLKNLPLSKSHGVQQEIYVLDEDTSKHKFKPKKSVIDQIVLSNQKNPEIIQLDNEDNIPMALDANINQNQSALSAQTDPTQQLLEQRLMQDAMAQTQQQNQNYSYNDEDFEIE